MSTTTYRPEPVPIDTPAEPAVRLIPKIRAFAQSGIGVLLIEQFATVALGLAKRAYVMEGGRLRFSGPAGELLWKPGGER